jgi:hypothetical protein
LPTFLMFTQLLSIFLTLIWFVSPESSVGDIYWRMSNEDFLTHVVFTWCSSWMSFLVHNMLWCLVEEFNTMTIFKGFLHHFTSIRNEECIIIIIFWCYWGLNSRSHAARQALYQFSYSTNPFFLLGIFEIGSWELFVQAGLKLLSS